MSVVDIEGKDLLVFRRLIEGIADQFASDYIWKIEVGIDDVDKAFKVKINNGIWTVPMGVKRP